MNKLAVAALGGVIVAAAGCSTELDSARSTVPSGTEFHRALYNGYLDLAQAELDENDFDDARFFANRAKLAARGLEVLPQPIRHRMLKPETAQTLSVSRDRLMAALAAGAAGKSPRQAAVAQLSFDCWLQEAEEDIQPDEIARCRNRFQAAVVTLGTSTAADKAEADVSPVAERQAVRTPLTAAGPRYTVLFGHDSDKLTPESAAVLRQAASEAKGKAAIVISGHADRSGPAAYNMKLSNGRAQAVARALANSDKGKAAVETRAFGEAQPAVGTEDGIREPRNRRVEISFREALKRTASRQ